MRADGPENGFSLNRVHIHKTVTVYFTNVEQRGSGTSAISFKLDHAFPCRLLFSARTINAVVSIVKKWGAKKIKVRFLVDAGCFERCCSEPYKPQDVSRFLVALCRT